MFSPTGKHGCTNYPRKAGINSDMNKINILSEEVVQQIAAGEVVERPFSVVKELVENAIDAGAKNIAVEIKNGGKKLIRVTDDGSGMAKEDTILCWKRHATSKIKNAGDLNEIKTLGFRGEALAAVGAVSRLEIITRTEKDEVGTLLKIEGGKEIAVHAHGCSVGTQIKVEDLFFNTPARLKFLRSTSTETARILDIIFTFALAYPKIGFKFSQNGRFLISENSNDMKTRIVSLLGKEYEDALIDVNKEHHLFKINGVVSKPSSNRATKDMQFLFVNGRSISDKILSHAVISAYDTLIPQRRWPVVVLFVSIDPRYVDVNVHPTKREIRWSNSQPIHDGIKDTIRESLNIHSAKTYSLPPAATSSGVGKIIPISREQVTTQKEPISVHEEQISWNMPALTVFGQFNNSYIIAEWQRKMVIVDQHAAHERILFEKLSKKEKILLSSQGLLIPLRIELNSVEYEVLKQHANELESFGFEVAEFGSNDFVIHTVPSVLNGKDVKVVIKDLLAEFTKEEVVSRISITDRIIKTIACRAAVMAGKTMEQTEMQKLVADLVQSNSPYCPHGRPAMVNFSLKEIEKLFQRR